MKNKLPLLLLMTTLATSAGGQDSTGAAYVCPAKYANAKYTNLMIESDEFDGYKKVRNKYAMTPYPDARNPITADFEMFLQQFTTKDGKVSYQFLLVYQGRGWIFIPSGESLVFLADGKRIGLSGDGSSRHRDVISGRSVRELAMYEITPQVVRALATAKDVRVKLRSNERGAVEFTIDSPTIGCVGQRFIREVIEPSENSMGIVK